MSIPLSSLPADGVIGGGGRRRGIWFGTLDPEAGHADIVGNGVPLRRREK